MEHVWQWYQWFAAAYIGMELVGIGMKVTKIDSPIGAILAMVLSIGTLVALIIALHRGGFW